jgi:DNA-binding XRE family transcriptional regulator
MKNLLKMRRWDAGMKQYELAIKLRCSAPYLSLVENGRVDPPEEFKALAAQIFKVSIEEIFPETVRVERILKNELSNRSNRINFDAY